MPEKYKKKKKDPYAVVKGKDGNIRLKHEGYVPDEDEPTGILKGGDKYEEVDTTFPQLDKDMMSKKMKKKAKEKAAKKGM